MSAPHQHSADLIQCLINLQGEATRADAKNELIATTSDLMPKGVPDLLGVVRFPMIRDLAAQHGRKVIRKVLFLLVKDFCASMNVVRNMNEEQMIEAAAMLLDECDNFRLEDYVMMFGLAKRGKLVDIRDRVDLQLITSILDIYWQERRQAGSRYQEEGTAHLDSLGSPLKTLELIHPQDAKLTQAAGNLLGALDQMRSKMTDWQKEDSQAELKAAGEKYQ